jgi:malate dehydrogenase
VIIGKNGVEKIVEIDLNKDEKEEFDSSVNSVKNLVEACQKIAPNLK